MGKEAGQVVSNGDAAGHSVGLLTAISARSSLGTASSSRLQTENEDEDDATVCEHDPAARFSRYDQEVGHGRFKAVYKGYDEKQGIDIAWSKINARDNALTPHQVHSIVQEMSKGLGIDHPNIIRCYLCWEDEGCINLITEYFTSGNLRDYRQRHKHLGMRAVKKWGRQILMGLAYLHAKTPPMVHGDLRCDKLYINGHTGEIKIGDLGLATLLSRRYPTANGVAKEGPPSATQQDSYTNSHINGAAEASEGTELSVPADIFCFGLCMLELVSLKKLDAGHCQQYQAILDSIIDQTAHDFISQCLGPEDDRPTALQLLDSAFFKSKGSGASAGESGGAPGPRGRYPPSRQDSELESSVSCEVGMVRGEDYTFHFSGVITDGKLAFRLHMQYEGDEGAEGAEPVEVGKRTINFEYDPDVDTPEKIAEEISGEFNLSSTDRDICAAALKEWLAKNAPGS